MKRAALSLLFSLPFMTGVYGQSPAPVPEAPAAPAAATPEAVIPQAYPLERYEQSWEKNPFLLKTAPVAGPPDLGWNIDWALHGMSNIFGKIMIDIQNRKTGEIKHVTEKSTEFKLVKANFDRDRTAASAEIEKDGKVATLTFDETLIASSPRGGGPGAPGGAGGTPMPTNLRGPAPNRGGAVPNAAGAVRPGYSTVSQPGAGGPQVMASNVNRGGLPGQMINGQAYSVQTGAGGVSTNTTVTATNPTFQRPPTAIVSPRPSGTGATVSNPQLNGVPTPTTRRRQLIPAPTFQTQPQQ